MSSPYFNYGLLHILKSKKRSDGYKVLIAQMTPTMLCVCCMNALEEPFAQRCFVLGPMPSTNKQVSAMANQYYSSLKDKLIRHELFEKDF